MAALLTDSGPNHGSHTPLVFRCYAVCVCYLRASRPAAEYKDSLIIRCARPSPRRCRSGLPGTGYLGHRDAPPRGPGCARAGIPGVGKMRSQSAGGPVPPARLRTAGDGGYPPGEWGCGQPSPTSRQLGLWPEAAPWLPSPSNLVRYVVCLLTDKVRYETI